jgi:type III secretion protein Q
VALASRIFGRDPGLQFQLGPHLYDLSIEPLFDNPVFKNGHVARVRMGKRVRFILQPEEKLLAMLLEETIPLEEFDELPPPVRGAALEASLESLLERVDHFSGARSAIERVEDRRSLEPFQAALILRLKRRTDALAYAAAVHTDAAGLEWLAARLGQLPGKVHRSLDHLPVAAHIELGRLTITQAETRELTPLDILLPQTCEDRSAHEIRLRFCDRLSLTGRLTAPDRVSITSLATTEEEPSPMPPTDTKSPTSAPDALPVSEVPVTLVFELGQTRLTLGELGQVQPGYTFQLSEAVQRDRPVTIKANGITVGQGEIVQIDDRIGIRIRSFNDDASRPKNT